MDGNFQVIVSDPYAIMQHVCGLPVTGLLKQGMSYSNYWNERGITKLDAMRSPLTYFSEHVILHLQTDDETEKWYRYCKLGIILNIHGHETFNFAGSDFDFDILATTSNPIMINGVYQEEYPVVYDAPKPKKLLLTEDALYEADTFAFGSIIGSITNKSSNAYAKLPLIEEQFGKESQEHRLLLSRLKQCCKAQSAQIDKAKIGQEVKGVPKVWVVRQKIKKNKKGNIIDNHAERKQLYNTTLLDKYPYFFRYVYKETDKAYKQYVDKCDIICRQKFRMGFSELEAKQNKTEEQRDFITNFYEYCPVTISNSPMNLLCRYLENVHWNISQKIKADTKSFDYSLYKRKDLDYLSYYNNAKKITALYLKELRCAPPPEQEEDILNTESLFQRLQAVNTNPYIITNCLIDFFYEERPTSNKDILWQVYGKYIYKNILKNTDATTALFPFPCSEDEADMEYLGYHYRLQEVKL